MHTPNLIHLARVNPALGYMLDNYKNALVPRIYTIHHVWNDSTPDVAYPEQTEDQMASHAWLYAAEFSIRVKNAWPGNPFRALSNADLTKQPYIDMALRTDGAGKARDIFIVTRNDTPIENIAKPATLAGPYEGGMGDAIMLWERQRVKALFTLRRDLEDNEIPFEVILALKCWQLDTCVCSFDEEAIEAWRSRTLNVIVAQ